MTVTREKFMRALFLVLSLVFILSIIGILWWMSTSNNKSDKSEGATTEVQKQVQVQEVKDVVASDIPSNVSAVVEEKKAESLESSTPEVPKAKKPKSKKTVRASPSRQTEMVSSLTESTPAPQVEASQVPAPAEATQTPQSDVAQGQPAMMTQAETAQASPPEAAPAPQSEASAPSAPRPLPFFTVCSGGCCSVVEMKGGGK